MNTQNICFHDEVKTNDWASARQNLEWDLSDQRRLRSDCADAQADLSLRWSHNQSPCWSHVQPPGYQKRDKPPGYPKRDKRDTCKYRLIWVFPGYTGLIVVLFFVRCLNYSWLSLFQTLITQTIAQVEVCLVQYLSSFYEGPAKSSVTNRLPWFYPRYILKCFTALDGCVE